MRKLLLILLLVAVAFIAFYRQRLFLHDPMGKVLVGGTAVKGARVMINYSNDVLVRMADGSSIIVQGWDRMPGHPEPYVCLRGLACLTRNDHAPKTPLGGEVYSPDTTMGDREISYRNGSGEAVRVIIR